MLSKEAIKNITSSSYFPDLQDYIISEINRLNNVDDFFGGISNERAGEEVKIRAKTVRRLQKIFSPFINFTEKKELTEEDLRIAKESYGL